MLEMAKKKSTVSKKHTLIVVPVAVIGNWFDQIEEHFVQGSISALKYSGPKRHELTEVDLKLHDVVVTSYSMIRSDWKHKKSECPIFTMNWDRVVLDEGHCIKDSTTLQAKACFDINAKCRWYLTGTPIQNSMTDLYSALKFLKITPFESRPLFKRFVEQPFAGSEELKKTIVTRIRQLCDAIMLRRTKRDGVVELPKRRIIKKRIVFTKKEEEYYEVLRNSQKLYFQEKEIDISSDIKALMNNYMSILASLSYMRQCCNSTNIIEKRVKTLADMREILQQAGATTEKPSIRKQSGNSGELSVDMKKRLGELLQEIYQNSVNLECKVCCCNLVKVF